jgi:hypothetical protein
MDPTKWIASFRALHQRVGRGEAGEEELRRHKAMREELAASLVASQGQEVPPGGQARKHFRVPQVFPVEVNNVYRVVTKDISRSGFSAMINATLEVGQDVAYSLTLARGAPPITGRARVAAVTKLVGTSRIGFAIDSINEADGERLEMALFDAVLARLK